MEPTVSVIIPTYNRAALLGRAIESALGQTHPRVEVIVVDDGSTDNTRGIVQAFGDGVVYLPSEHCGNLSAVRNRGLRQANGTFICFLDSDDTWMPQKLEKQLRCFENPKVTLSYTDLLLRTETGLSPPSPPLKLRNGRIVAFILRGNVISPVTLMFRKEILQTTGLLREDLRAMGDFYFILQLAGLGEACCVAEPLATVRRQTGHHSSDFEVQNLQDIIRALESFRSEAQLSMAEKRAFRRYKAHIYAILARRYEQAGETQNMKKHARDALRGAPLSPGLWKLFLQAGRR